MICMLYRARSADSVEFLATVLRRFDAVHPHATVSELMGVLMYRGHSYAGLEWSDRFQPELLAAASQIPAADPDDAALMAACRWTNDHYEGPKAYASTFTLRDALEQHKLDCVRATDMIGAIFRNCGRPRFGHVRWCAETNGHSVAAYFANRDGKRLEEKEKFLSPAWVDEALKAGVRAMGWNNQVTKGAVALIIGVSPPAAPCR